MEEERTIAYFDTNTPEYSVRRMDYALEAINRYSQQGSSLVDIGCGTGNILELIRDESGLQDLCGIDVSQNCLLKARERVECDILLGSILDNDCVERMSRKFDFALLGAVLHHLVGRNRKESMDYASLAISNSLRLLKNGGYLIVLEPAFYPALAMDIVFYIKKLITSVTSGRVQILGTWNNIGAPVVSYYTNEQLVAMIECTGRCQIVGVECKDLRIDPLWRLALITRRTDTTIVAKKV
jgi:SAM-dependent methyltransferase